jgi:hypothetical protein
MIVRNLSMIFDTTTGLMYGTGSDSVVISTRPYWFPYEATEELI